MNKDEDDLRTRLRWLLAGVTALVYWQVSSHDFVNYDDPVFVSSNPHVYSGLSLGNIIWSMTTLNGGATSYQPLVWLTHQLDCQLFGLTPGAQHLTNLWFHVANTLLVFTLLDKLTRKVWRSAVVAALFALHPLHVETVAWISERKSLVCVFFWLLTTLAYVRYANQGGSSRYLLVLLLFTASLLSKPIAVSLPLTLLLLDYWPLARLEGPKQEIGALLVIGDSGSGPPGSGQPGRQPTKSARLVRSLRAVVLGPLMIEKIPLFLLSAIACLVTLIAQSDLGATKSLEEVPMGVRVSNSVVACVLYLWKMLWPADLAPIYPLRHDWASWQVAGCGLSLLLISGGFLGQAGKRGYLIVGWLWYLVTLLPTLGLIQVGSQGMADRYSYVPLIGIFLLLIWSVPERLGEGLLNRVLIGTGAAALVGACAVCTFVNVRYWHDSLHLFQHSVQATSGNYIACCQLGVAFGTVGNIPEAERLFREAIRMKPDQLVAQLDLGEALFRKGDDKGALECYLLALKLKPMEPKAHGMMAGLLFRAKDPQVHELRKALEESRLACSLSHFGNRQLLEDLVRICTEGHEFREARDTAKKARALCVLPEEVEGIERLVTDIGLEEQAKAASKQASAADGGGR